jgi:diacylglycerol kinase family enzyme
VIRAGGRADVGPAIANEMATNGGAMLAVMGDDPAIRSAVSSLMASRTDGQPLELGILAASPACDFVRTFGIPPDQPAFAAERLLTAPPFPIDVAEVTYVDHSGAEATTHFAGLAEVGFGGAVLRREARARIGRTAAFSAFWLTRMTFRTHEMRVVGERREFVGPTHDVIVGNAQYGRHGIRLSPRSFPGDGALDLLIMTGPASQQVRLLPKMFQGEHLPDDTIQEFRARHIRIECDRPVPMHADGEYLGTTPVRIELIQHAVTLRI